MKRTESGDFMPGNGGGHILFKKYSLFYTVESGKIVGIS